MIPVYTKHWRLVCHWTQQKLARRSGVPQSAISLMEQGKKPDVTLSTVGRLASALGLAPHELLVTPPREALALDRHQREAIGRAVVRGTPPPPGIPAQLVRDLAGLVSQKLRAFGVPGRKLNRGRRWKVQRRWRDLQARYGDALIHDLVHRIDTELLRRE